MNDPASFDNFVLNYQDMVYSTAFRLLGNESEAEDVAQETFVRAWKHWAELGDGTAAGGWLKTVARNLCLNHLQRYRNRWTLFTDLRRSDDEESPDPDIVAPDDWDEATLTADQRTILTSAISSLPRDQRVALVLFHFEGLDYVAIAEQLKVSLGKVKTDIFRARAALRKKLQPLRETVGV
jgi:RNA polymerase sigma-70 factor (ECF subfamily)